VTAPLPYPRDRFRLCLGLCLIAGCATHSADRRAETGQASSNLSQTLAQNAARTAGVVTIRNEATSNVDAQLPVGLTFSPFVAKKQPTSGFVQDPFLEQFLPENVAQAGKPQSGDQGDPGRQPPAKLRRADVLRTALERDQHEQLRPVRARDQALQDARKKLRAASQALDAGEFNRAYTQAIEAERILEESATALSPDEQSPTALIQEIRRRMSQRSDQNLFKGAAIPERNGVESLALDRESAAWRRLPIAKVELLSPPDAAPPNAAPANAAPANAAPSGQVGVPQLTTARPAPNPPPARQPRRAPDTNNSSTVGPRPTSPPSVASVQAGFTEADNGPSALLNAAAFASGSPTPQTGSQPPLSTGREWQLDSAQQPPTRPQNLRWESTADTPEPGQPELGQPELGEQGASVSNPVTPAATIALPRVRFAPLGSEESRGPLTAQLGIGFLGLLLAGGGLMRLVFRRTAC